MWLLVACADPAPPPTPAVEGVEVPTLAAYTAACEAALGPIPAVDCDDSIEVPTAPGPDGTCDRPSPISGCTAGNRVGSARTAAGAVYHWICRRTRDDTPEGLYDDIALIGHHPETGAACFWGAPADGQRRTGVFPHPGGFVGGPHPGDDDGYWADLEALAPLRCRECHATDPVLATPWIRATGVVDNDPLAPFDLFGADVLEALAPGGWRPVPTLTAADAAPCTSCHPIAAGFTCALAVEAAGREEAALASPAARVWPMDRWMDVFEPDALLERYGTASTWEAAWSSAADAVAACCRGERPPGDCFTDGQGQ